uniref:Uncharacterized protein n=1 Tax=Sinocyclocheilus anshuiensis TaxID=1608454 RepID=A0A671PPH8_9TELE
MYYVFMQMLSSGPAWLSIILLIIVSLLPDVVKKVLCRALWPTTTERIQVRQHNAHYLHVHRDEKIQVAHMSYLYKCVYISLQNICVLFNQIIVDVKQLNSALICDHCY